MVETNKEKPAFQNIKDLTNGSSETQSLQRLQKQSPGVLCEKDALKNFSKLTGKQLLWDFVLIKLLAKKRL